MNYVPSSSILIIYTNKKTQKSMFISVNKLQKQVVFVKKKQLQTHKHCNVQGG